MFNISYNGRLNLHVDFIPENGKLQLYQKRVIIEQSGTYFRLQRVCIQLKKVMLVLDMSSPSRDHSVRLQFFQKCSNLSQLLAYSN